MRRREEELQRSETSTGRTVALNAHVKEGSVRGERRRETWSS